MWNEESSSKQETMTVINFLDLLQFHNLKFPSKFTKSDTSPHNFCMYFEVSFWQQIYMLKEGPQHYAATFKAKLIIYAEISRSS